MAMKSHCRQVASVIAISFLVCLVYAPTAKAQSGCFGDILSLGPRAEVSLTLDRTYTGSYRHGEPYDYLTINPGGTGETFADAGITLKVRLLCVPVGASLDQGQPIAGLPADRIVLFGESLCVCDFKQADHATDENGWTEFSGTISGGGCAEGLTLYVEHEPVATIPVNINSTDTGVASPCHTDASDLNALAARLGVPGEWSICFDYNKSGPPTIDSGDLAYFASVLGASCQ